MNLYTVPSELDYLKNKIYNDELDQGAELFNKDFKDNFKKIAIDLASEVKNLEAESEAIKNAMANMKDRKDKLDSKADRIVEFLKNQMTQIGINEIKDSPYFKIKLKNNPDKVVVEDETKLEEGYFRRKEVVEVDKAKLREEMLAGVVIEGAYLVKTNRLEIK